MAKRGRALVFRDAPLNSGALAWAHPGSQGANIAQMAAALLGRQRSDGRAKRWSLDARVRAGRAPERPQRSRAGRSERGAQPALQRVPGFPALIR